VRVSARVARSGVAHTRASRIVPRSDDHRTPTPHRAASHCRGLAILRTNLRLFILFTPGERSCVAFAVTPCVVVTRDDSRHAGAASGMCRACCNFNSNSRGTFGQAPHLSKLLRVNTAKCTLNVIRDATISQRAPRTPARAATDGIPRRSVRCQAVSQGSGKGVCTTTTRAGPAARRRMR
jgi:hypothetical protein